MPAIFPAMSVQSCSKVMSSLLRICLGPIPAMDVIFKMRLKKEDVISLKDLSIPEAVVTVLNKHTQEGGKTMETINMEGQQVVVGHTKPSLRDLYLGSTKAVKKILSTKVEKAVLVTPDLSLYPRAGLTQEEALHTIAVAARLATYSYGVYKSKDNVITLKSLSIVPQGASFDDSVCERILAAANLEASCIELARDLGNTRVTDVDMFYDILVGCLPDGVENKSLDSDECHSNGLNLLNSVGDSAPSKGRLAIFEYQGAEPKDPYFAMIGKGITFDAGGLNIKNAGCDIHEMHSDKCGAANAFGAFVLAVRSGVKRNIVCALPLAENLVDMTSTRPGAIIKSHKGLTVEIKNTDAEGRLVMADAMSYIGSNYALNSMIDIATLTGNCTLSIGPFAVIYFSNSEDFHQKTEGSISGTMTRVVRFPMYEEYLDIMKEGSAHADICNLGAIKEAGTSKAAAFLSCFVPDHTPWVHFDIAGTEYQGREVNGQPPQANGHMVPVLFNLIKSGDVQELQEEDEE